jgi:hypothetical protein
MTSQISRRDVLRSGLGTASIALLPWSGRAFGRSVARDAEPHYFMQIMLPDGLDCSYMFDARPLAMTAANLQSNYLAEEPTQWTGSNGQSTWATRLVQPLAPFRDRFSVLNGVVMAASFDGHDQNTNQLFTGNPFGGESFVPHLNAGDGRTSIDYVQMGLLYADVTNAGASMPVQPASAYALVNRLRAAAQLEEADPLWRFVKSRMAAAGQGRGRFSAAAGLMGDGAIEAPGLAAKLRGLDIAVPNPEDDLGDSLKVIAQFFRADVSRAAVITIRPKSTDPQSFATLDTHGADQAKDSASFIGSVVEQLVKVIDSLASTPFDEHRSMLDMTTIAVGSEFSRTMRQRGAAIDETGTDHNPLRNSILLGGKGVRGGLVVGESDSRTPDEVLSGAHRTFDPEHLKVMGRPFDPRSMRPVDALPNEYFADQYLSAATVANTIYTIFGVDASKHWKADRNSDAAQPLRGLLT